MYPSSINSITVSAGGSNIAAATTQITISVCGVARSLAMSTISDGTGTGISTAVGGYNSN
jgi:hypothetical protein